MRLIDNRGTDRVADLLADAIDQGVRLDLATPHLSVFAFQALAKQLQRVDACRLVLPNIEPEAIELTGAPVDRAARNQLQIRWLAASLARWLQQRVDVKQIGGPIPQASIAVSEAEEPFLSLMGNCGFSTEGLGLVPGPDFGMVTASESPAEARAFAERFLQVWNSLKTDSATELRLLSIIEELVTPPPPTLVYHRILRAVFEGQGEDLDENRVIRSGTGIRDTTVWRKLYHFQRDGVIGAIDKLESHGGCIIADSVGLGKTFEALAIIKYYELRNDRVLVLCPKRLRENWTIYRLNDRRNPLMDDRMNFDVLNHTDLSRDSGLSGDVNLAHLNWGNYDLVVIDESHNFRNNPATRDRETRYQRLMRRIVKEGVPTRVLMLSATPVNNRLADLKNQIAFATEGRDDALRDYGIDSIRATTRLAQGHFNRWLDLPEERRSPEALVDRLGFDYFKLLDLLTIARSRQHVVHYYGTAETGTFPTRLPPENLKTEIDLAQQLPPIQELNDEIRRLTLASYAPLQYVLPQRRKVYADTYRTRVEGGARAFEQGDREQSLIHLMRVNLLKRLESSVHAFALTVARLLAQVEELLDRLDEHDEGDVETPTIEDIDLDDPLFESLSVGRKVRVLLADVDRRKWRQDLAEDKKRLSRLLEAAQAVDPRRDAKLIGLKNLIQVKVEEPINQGNRKVLVFTASGDTAAYLYEQIAPWAQNKLGLHAALVSGSSPNRCTLDGPGTDMASILEGFAPVAKNRPPDFADQGEIDLLIATDCISEGQNLQDCDTVVNYDIHWNPVRIVQRFGRIDRLGSPNDCIQLVNFWPNLELEEYINLEQRVSGRMVLLDVSATGEENIIERHSGDPMNDLEYRRRQLLQLQEEVIDLEDLSNGVSITDLTLTDFRLDLARALDRERERLDRAHLGLHAVVEGVMVDGEPIPPGTLFCLRAETERARQCVPPGYPLSAHYLVHAGDDGAILLPFTHAKAVLDRLRRLCADTPRADRAAWQRHDERTGDGRDMSAIREQLAAAVVSIVGVEEKRAVESLFTPGGTHGLTGEFPGIDDFEVVAFVIVLGHNEPREVSA